MLTRATIAAVLILVIMLSYGQEWPKIFGDNIHVSCRDIDEDYDKGLLLTSYTYNNSGALKYGWLFKTDINGVVLWEKKFGADSYIVSFTCLEKTFDGGMIISGFINKYDPNGLSEPLFLKLNYCGEVEWCRVISSDFEFNTYARSIVQLSDSGYLGLMAYYTVNNETYRISLIKLSELGEPLWIKPLAHKDTLISNEEGSNLNLTSQGNYLVSGRCYYPGLTPFWILTDTLGEQIWDLKWNQPGFGVGGVSETVEGINNNYYSAGGMSGLGRPMTPAIFKFDQSGNALYHSFLLGDTIIGGGAKTLCLFNDTTIIAGFNWTDNPDPAIGCSEIIQTDTLGNYINKRLLIEKNRTPERIITSFDNKILVCGNYVVDGNWDIYLWKLNSDLQDDTLYTQPFTYDSLCPYPIVSDTVDLNCSIFVDIDEIPTKEEYDEVIKLFPNPVESILNVKCLVFNDGFGKVFEVWDIFGRKVEEVRVPESQQQFQIDVSTYPPGIYIAILKNQNRVLARKKFVVSR